MCFKGEVLGVVAVFSRRRIERRELGWLRVFADHAAVAIANARAFQEIEDLKNRLERERDYLREAWWISTFPGLGIMLTVLAMNLLGDGLRDVLDPRLKV